MSISSITKSFLPVARHLPVTARSATHTFHRAIYTPPPHHLFKLERRFSTQPPGSAKASKVLNTDEKNLKTILDRATTTTDFLEIVRLVQDLRLDTDQLILVCHKLVEKGHAPKVSKHFIELGLAYRLSLKQKISLLDAITSSPQFSDKVATTLIENYSTLRLGNASEEERFHVLKKIIAKREITASKAVNNFSQFVYSSTLHKLFAQSKFMWYGPNLAEKPSEQFLLFLEEAARSGPQAVKAIIENYSHIGLPRATLTQRISLCCEMTKSGSEAACMVIQYFSRFCLDESSFEQKSPIFYEVGKSGSDAISEISKHFRQLGLDKVSTQERFCLFAKIAETNPESCRAILDLFDELDLKFTPLEDRFAFACRIVDLSWSSNPNDIEVLYRFDNLHLNELTIEQKLSFCHKIVNSKHSSPSLISYLKDLNLKDASV